MFEPYSDWAILSIFVVIYSLVGGRIRRTWISDAMVFVFMGLLLGPFGLGMLQFDVTSENLKTVTELTLALILFNDAANANTKVLKQSLRLPWRLLALGLPLTILLGFALSTLLFPQFSPVEAGLLAVMLAPTDAALGKAVVSNPKIPDNIREDLNIESGLNDGICVPLLFALLAITTGENLERSPLELVAILFTEEIGIGLLVGVSFAVITNQLREFFIARNWIEHHWQPVMAIALALGCFSTAQHFGGSGFIACFVGGLMFGIILKRGKEELLIASEAVGDNLSLITWVAFGSSLVMLAVRQQTWQTFLYAVLSLTVIRMLPVFLVLFGMELDKWTKLLVGWFGPRGLASVVFAVFIFDAKLPHSSEIVIIAITTIMLSILAHGLTANPLVNLYGKWINK
ncbi:putative Na+/H+ antiporter [Crocosphaera subtropica ATCC 51142]|uniref:Na+/H+ antiporter n=1 Tax=Crocosphaera subtropica (strain ATCC 51142 / BH68) TaxID=43989 RepID=B1WVE2_CROS5|nr:cation:proton antiporter [Crocosphaera subtropica]ACB53932.1 putative Na+/H+ antiporter [Crocosphaera subtropica ATCC 51142]